MHNMLTHEQKKEITAILHVSIEVYIGVFIKLFIKFI